MCKKYENRLVEWGEIEIGKQKRIGNKKDMAEIVIERKKRERERDTTHTHTHRQRVRETDRNRKRQRLRQTDRDREKGGRAIEDLRKLKQRKRKTMWNL